MLLALLIPAAYAAQIAYGGGSPEPAARLLGLAPRDLWQGRGSGIFTYVFLNVGLTPVILAALFTLVLGAPFARRMPGAMGFAGLLSFFLLCGAAGGLVFALLQPEADKILVGSSAAVSGLLAAAVRSATGRGRVGPLLNPMLLAIGALWLIGNLAAALTDVMGASAFNQYGWQAHVAGFLAGAVLADPWSRLFGPSVASFDSPDDLRDPPV